MDGLAQEKNLEQARDEKVIPVAKEILNDLAEKMMPEDANASVDYNPVIMSILQRSLDADLNVTTENPYIFQLILKVFSGLNAAVQLAEVRPIDDVRFGAIAKKILQITASANLTFGDITDEAQAAEFTPVREQLNKLVREEDLSMMEIKYIMDSIFAAFGQVNTIFLASVEQSTKKMEAKILGIEDMTDLSMKKLDETLKA